MLADRCVVDADVWSGDLAHGFEAGWTFPNRYVVLKAEITLVPSAMKTCLTR